MRRLGLVLIVCIAGCQGPRTREEVPLYYDIGGLHREVTTSSAKAQVWFDRGLALTFGFNHEEAIRCFEKAAGLDPSCAMAYWGKAYALGPNYNNLEMTEEACQAAYDALQKAIARSDGCTDAEKALIEALRTRYPSPTVTERAPIEVAYADAMRKVHAAYPDDGDVAALTAEALMLVRPWKLWSPEGEMAEETPEIREVLEEGLRRWPDHPALCHLYIHTMEAGPEVSKAIPAAQTLEELAPGLGHLVHMPSHVYTWTGRYEDVIRVNAAAVQVDRAYVDHAGKMNFYTLYRLHNYHFLAYGGMFAGQRGVAMKAARQIPKEIPPELLSEFVDFLDIFVATPYHVMVRFGLWDEILAEPEPAEDLLASRAVHHYARGIALAVLGRVDESAKELETFREAMASVPETRLLFNNPVAEILKVAEKVLAGELEYRRKNYDEAFALLREGVELDRQLNYDEPWGWMEPPRHALGALLTEQGRYEEAIEVYQANLARYPENGWALHGLSECLRRLGRESEAALVRARFEKAWAKADTTIPGSCFCRTQA